MIKLICKIILLLIKFLEVFEFSGLSLDENDPSKKILNSIELEKGRYSILSETGWSPLTHLHLTQPYKIHKLLLSNGYKLDCADNHTVFRSDMAQVFVADLKQGDFILTDDGPMEVISMIKSSLSLSMMDCTVDSPTHSYYSNGILSHNTVSAAIMMTHYCIFNNDKTIMIVANKGATVIEILDKIKDIYKLLPFFLQPGVTNMNQSSMIFGDTGCRIRTAARSKEPAIGFTIDLLYLDEFAHIPRNIIEPYYRAAYPTVSAVKNSKIIITSTPNGLNLFHRILIDSERKEGDSMKNGYKSLRVYWYQVPGRFMSYVRMNRFKLEKFGLTYEDVLTECKRLYDPNNERDTNKIAYVEKVTDFEKGIEVINILSRAGIVDTDDVRRIEILNRFGEKVSITKVAIISSWKEDTIRDIGSIDAFNQEYGLAFINGSRMLFDEKTMSKIVNNTIPFAPMKIDNFDMKLHSDYKELEWIQNKPALFDLADIKKYHLIFSVDLAEGLGQDYSVINIFRLVPRSKEELENGIFTDIYDCFRLEQVGIWRNNLANLDYTATILYLIVFELADPEKCKITLEYNTYGESLLSKMPGVFGGRNEYGSFVFFKYFHRADADKPKIGLKVNNNKKMLVKDYQHRLSNTDVVLHEQTNIYEVKTFIKEETSLGTLKFHAESGHDDTVMTVVNMCTVFQKSEFRSMIEVMMQHDLPAETSKMIDSQLGNSEFSKSADYSALNGMRKGQLPAKRDFSKFSKRNR